MRIRWRRKRSMSSRRPSSTASTITAGAGGGQAGAALWQLALGGRVLTGHEPGLLNTAVGAEVGGEAQLGDGGTPVPQQLVLLPAVVDAIGQHRQHPQDQDQHQGPSHQAKKQEEQQAQDQSHAEGTSRRGTSR